MGSNDSATGPKKRTYTTSPTGSVINDTHYAYNILGQLTSVQVVEANDVNLSLYQTTTDKYNLMGNLREQAD